MIHICKSFTQLFLWLSHTLGISPVVWVKQPDVEQLPCYTNICSVRELYPRHAAQLSIVQPLRQPCLHFFWDKHYLMHVKLMFGEAEVIQIFIYGKASVVDIPLRTDILYTENDVHTVKIEIRFSGNALSFHPTLCGVQFHRWVSSALDAPAHVPRHMAAPYCLFANHNGHISSDNGPPPPTYCVHLKQCATIKMSTLNRINVTICSGFQRRCEGS